MQNRSSAAFKNSVVLTVIQISTVLVKFISQTFFIKFLGKDLLGLNGLFTNVISVLSFAELGVGTAIVFSLYQPLAEDNKDQIRSLMKLFGTAYKFIGCLIGALGLFLMPFLKFLIKDFDKLNNVYLYFMLFLLNATISYFFSYKRSLLIADQREYISTINIFLFLIIQTVMQIFVIVTFKSYKMFLLIAILCTLCSNIVISRKVDNTYSYLRKKSPQPLSKRSIRKIKTNVVGMIGSKIGSIVVRSTDNLLLSAFIGVGIVGIYSNYLLIVNSVSLVLIKLVSSVTASVGNLLAEKNSKKNLITFRRHFFINFALVSVSSLCLLTALPPFVRGWAGDSFVLSQSVTMVIVLNYFIDQIRQSSIMFISALGLFVPNGKKSVVEAIVNLVLSGLFLFIFKGGIVAVLSGTIVTNLLINSWWEPKLIFYKGLNEQSKFSEFFKKIFLIRSLTSLIAIFVFSKGILMLDSCFEGGYILTAIVNVLLSCGIMGIYLLVLYGHTDEYRFVVNFLKRHLLNIEH